MHLRKSPYFQFFCEIEGLRLVFFSISYSLNLGYSQLDQRILYKALTQPKERNHYLHAMITTKLIECPRDAMQGLHEFIATDAKARYINQLLKVGYDVIDFGSFVSPKAIPQMRDTAEVLSNLDLDNTNT